MVVSTCERYIRPFGFFLIWERVAAASRVSVFAPRHSS